MTPTLASPLERARQFLRSPLFPIFMIVFVDVLGVGITMPVMPLYASGALGASAFQVTLLSSVYFTAQFLAAPRLGRLSDRVGRRPVLILSQAGTFLALLLSGLAHTLPILYFARAIDGLTGGNISVAQAYLSDITAAKDRARGIGIVNAAFSSGFIFGPAFGSLMAARYGPRVPFFIAAGISLLTITLSTLLLPESLTAERRKNEARPASTAQARRTALLATPQVPLIMAVGFLGQFAFFHFQTTYVLWAAKVVFPERDPQFVQAAIGGVLTFVGLAGVMAQLWLVGPLVKNFGERVMVPAGFALRGLAWLGMVLAPQLGILLAVTPLLAVGNGVAQPALLALLTYAAPPGERGYAIGTMESVQGLGRILGPVIAGLLFERVNPNAPLAVAVGLSVITVAVSLSLWRAPLPTEQPR